MREVRRAFAACVLLVCLECLSVPVPVSVPGTAVSVPADSPVPVSRATPHERSVKNSSLVNELRRRLMEDNYDYMPSESEEPLVKPSPLFSQKVIDIIKFRQHAASSPAPAPAAPPASLLDRTQLEFDLQYNDHLEVEDINLKREHARVDKQLYEYQRKENNRVFTDKNKYDQNFDRDYAIIKREHERLRAHYQNPTTTTDSNYEKEDIDKSNQRFLEPDGDVVDETRVPTVNDRIMNSLERRHRAGGLGLMGWGDLDPEGVPIKQIEIKNEAGFYRRLHDERPAEGSGEAGRQAVHKNDLLYYMTDERLQQAERNYLDFSNREARADRALNSSTTGGFDTSYEEYADNNETTTTVKYNVFTVRSGRRSGRRSGGRGAVRARRTFVREQRPGEVVVVALDDQPLPQFRLPAARRQYMLDAEASR